LILVSVVPRDEPVTLSSIQWQIAVHIGDAPPLSQLQSRVAISEPDLLKAIIDLRDRRLLEFG